MVQKKITEYIDLANLPSDRGELVDLLTQLLNYSKELEETNKRLVKERASGDTSTGNPHAAAKPSDSKRYIYLVPFFNKKKAPNGKWKKITDDLSKFDIIANACKAGAKPITKPYTHYFVILPKDLEQKKHKGWKHLPSDVVAEIHDKMRQ